MNERVHDDPMGVSAAFLRHGIRCRHGFFAEAPAGAIIACELCLLVRKRETAVEYHVREGVLRVAVSALFFVCVNRAIFFKCTSDQRSWCLGVCFGVLVASTHQGNVARASPLC